MELAVLLHQHYAQICLGFLNRNVINPFHSFSLCSELSWVSLPMLPAVANVYNTCHFINNCFFFFHVELQIQRVKIS